MLQSHLTAKQAVKHFPLPEISNAWLDSDSGEGEKEGKEQQ